VAVLPAAVVRSPRGLIRLLREPQRTGNEAALTTHSSFSVRMFSAAHRLKTWATGLGFGVRRRTTGGMSIAIYHFEAKVITRTTGRTVVGAAAYMSCSEMTSEYDGIHHDYRRKQGLIFERVFLPGNAPAEWADREKLWNAVEAAETAKDSRLARQVILALPLELSQERQEKLVVDFVYQNFVSDGMCADVAIHDPDGKNPHAHIMLTIRPLDANGKWQSKTEKEYLCMKDGEERGLTSSEFKAMQSEGWEKQYPYKVGKKKVYMVPSEAEVQGYVRASKYPKCTRYGRQNPICERWNSEDQLQSWRAAWSEAANKALEQIGSEERIDHRSHAECGLEEQPTVHEGVTARSMEKKGITSERCELNRQIRKDNALLHRLKAHVAELAQKIRDSMSGIADRLGDVWMCMVESQYHREHIHNEQQDILNDLRPVLDDYERYRWIQDSIEKLSARREELVTQRKAIPILQIRKRQELSEQIDSLASQIEAREKNKEFLLKTRRYPSEKEMIEVGNRIHTGRNKLEQLKKTDKAYASELNRAAAEYDALMKQAQDYAAESLSSMQADIRSRAEQRLADRLKQRYGDLFQKYLLKIAIQGTEERIKQHKQNPQTDTKQQSKSMLQRLMEAKTTKINQNPEVESTENISNQERY